MMAATIIIIVNKFWFATGLTYCNIAHEVSPVQVFDRQPSIVEGKNIKIPCGTSLEELA
jgi:hypothetical protein